MKDPTRWRPQLESLESVTLLSGPSAAVHGVLAALATTASSAAAVHLTGTARGTYHVSIANPDTGKDYTFLGSGQIAPLGTATLNGAIQSPGFIAIGHSTGSLVLSTPKGSVTLNLTGPPQKGFTPVPDVFNFTITKATGTFKGDHGTGYIDLVLGPARPIPTPIGVAPNLPVEQGTFTMIFLTVPPP
jgi:hypothetical protein